MNPGDVAALLAKGRPREALELARAAVQREPGDAIAWNTLGAVLVQMGDPVEAERALAEALRLYPDSMETRFNLALASRQRGELATARARFEEILARWPGETAARFELAGVLVAEGSEREALPHLEALLEEFPGQPQVLAHLAAAQAGAGQAQLAAQTCERLLASPEVGAGQIASVAYTLASLGRVQEAVDAARRALSMAPDSLDVRSIAAGALAHAGNAGEAQHHFAAIAVRRPRAASTWHKLGLAALASGDWAQAVQAFGRQLELAPADRWALASLGAALNAADAREEAIAVFERALAAGHRDAGMLSALVQAKGMVCDWSDLDRLVTELRAVALAPSRTPAQPQSALYLETTAAEQRTWAENWARVEFANVGAPFATAPAHDSRRLRVGYLSADFCNHAVGFLMTGLLEHHDRARFEVFAYSAGRDDASAARRRIVDAVEHFVDIGELPARLAAQRIAADRIDVLLDLGGYVKNSCIGILALRPAPVQGHFLGYPGTTGAPFVDFIVADAVVVPEGGESHFTERVLRMPACYQPNDPQRGRAPAKARAALGIADHALVLCSFNQGVKIRPAVFARWCALLEALPGAILWLSDNGEAANARLRRAAQQRNVDPARIVYAPYVPQDEHIARLRTADIALDTFPYTSHTTASDALWAGLPLVTTFGETFASRVAASVLRAAGCGDWAFDNAERAFDAALALARDARLRERARARLAASLPASALFDAAAYARHFEALLMDAARPRTDR